MNPISTVRASCVCGASAQSPASRTVPGPSDRDLQPVSGHIGVGVALVVTNSLACSIGYGASHPWYRATAGSDQYRAKASTSDSRKRRRNSLCVLTRRPSSPQWRRRLRASVKFQV